MPIFVTHHHCLRGVEMNHIPCNTRAVPRFTIRCVSPWEIVRENPTIGSPGAGSAGVDCINCTHDTLCAIHSIHPIWQHPAINEGSAWSGTWKVAPKVVDQLPHIILQVLAVCCVKLFPVVSCVTLTLMPQHRVEGVSSTQGTWECSSKLFHYTDASLDQITVWNYPSSIDESGAAYTSIQQHNPMMVWKSSQEQIRKGLAESNISLVEERHLSRSESTGWAAPSTPAVVLYPRVGGPGGVPSLLRIGADRIRLSPSPYHMPDSDVALSSNLRATGSARV